MTLVEIGTTLKNFTLFALEPAYYDMKISARDAKRDTIEDVKGRNDCILLRISRTYRNMTALRPTPGKTIPSYEGIWKTGVCISLMPKTPIPMKRGDGKTYFEISKRIMADSGRVTRMPIIKTLATGHPSRRPRAILQGRIGRTCQSDCILCRP